MARKRKLRLTDLENHPHEDFRLPSLLENNRLEGAALRYTIFLPLLSDRGEEVFSYEDHIGPILRLLSRRFGGFTRSNISPQSSIQGGWFPEGAEKAVIDQHLEIRIYCRNIEAADQFFRRLKSLLLNSVRHQPQDEILVEKVPVWLVPRE
jgi:hypothetical protein